jgi:hypothetical protein
MQERNLSVPAWLPRVDHITAISMPNCSASMMQLPGYRMSERVYRVSPLYVFLGFFLPGGALAVILGLLAVVRLPFYATMLLQGLVLLAFVVAVGAATASVTGHHVRTEGQGPVLRLLDLRRNRMRYAGLFAVIAVASTEIAIALLAQFGVETPGSYGAGAVLARFFIFFVVAWLLISEAAGTPDAMRRALLGERASR